MRVPRQNGLPGNEDFFLLGLAVGGGVQKNQKKTLR